MSKRYVFWRRPDGKPHKDNDDKFAPVELLAEYGRTASVEPNGGVARELHIHALLQTALRGCAIVICPDGQEMNETDAWSILDEALIAVARTSGGRQPLKPAAVLSAANSSAGAHFRKPVAEYILVASLSIGSFPAKRMNIGGCEIRPLSSRQRHPYPDKLQTEGSSERLKRHIRETRYQFVQIRTKGRTFCEAEAKGFRALTLLRGLWSLSVLRGFPSMGILFSPSPNPIGVVHAGPIRTLHLPAGKLASDLYWYDHTPNEDQKLFEPPFGWGRIEQFRRWAMNRILRVTYRADVEDLIIRYALALDQQDHDAAFLRMWSILEKVTNTVGANYDETIRRAVWPLPDRQLAKALLAPMRLRRNLLVHSSKSGDDPDQAAYMVKSYVEPHVILLIRNDFAVTSLEEYARYLALPTDLPTLKRDKERMGKAIQFLRKRAGSEKEKGLSA